MLNASRKPATCSSVNSSVSTMLKKLFLNNYFLIKQKLLREKRNQFFFKLSFETYLSGLFLFINL